MKKIVCFASGSGSNVKSLFFYSQSACAHFKIETIVVNKIDSPLIDFAQEHNLNIEVIQNNFEILTGQSVWSLPVFQNIDLIVLAGFLRKISKEVVSRFPNKIINIHPSLLPKYGGKGMYGIHVHRAVLQNAESESGITIHYVDSEYDEGTYILQKSIGISENETALSLQNKIQKLEHQYFPEVINNLLK